MQHQFVEQFHSLLIGCGLTMTQLCQICSKSATSVLYFLPSAAGSFSCLQFLINSSAPSSFRRFFSTVQ
jgi:hypothetical protein